MYTANLSYVMIFASFFFFFATFERIITMAMEINFQKYHGTGNDFIIIDNRQAFFPANDPERKELAGMLCNRNFGIGADGLILLENDGKADFSMRYFNSDGLPGSFCGNGSRCAVAFAYKNSIIKNRHTRFVAADGLHEAAVSTGNNITYVKVYLSDADQPATFDTNVFFANTGSPHVVLFRENIDELDVVKEGRKIRNEKRWQPGGTNVNFVKHTPDGRLYVRTYERGVENETLSCGSGVAAAALAAHYKYGSQRRTYAITTRGGDLKVGFLPPARAHEKYSDISLEGPATYVFNGTLAVNNY